MRNTSITPPKSLVLLEDLSNGREQVPIVCVVDQDVMGEPCSPSCSLCTSENSRPSDVDGALRPWDSLFMALSDFWILHWDLTPREEQCSPHSCDHVSMFDNDNTKARDIHGQLMCSQFPYDSVGQIIVEYGIGLGNSRAGGYELEN
ncbi:unnamed protein product [Sphagnum tenellum]